jgi:uncharacterized UBP type Zn finger protein
VSTDSVYQYPMLAIDKFLVSSAFSFLSLDRNKEEMYRHLSIDVEDVNGPRADTRDENRAFWSVQKGIDQFFASEKREVKCEKCNEGKTATQTLQILSR